ncbi:MAG: hypothetical protein U1F08_01855 [Steroidobacteraceae bacterium]
MLTDLKSLLKCLEGPVDCPHCGHRCEQLAGQLRSDGMFTCPACGRAAIVDAGHIDRAVAAAAGTLREQALDLGRSLEGGAPTVDGDHPRPAGRADHKPN